MIEHKTLAEIVASSTAASALVVAFTAGRALELGDRVGAVIMAVASVCFSGLARFIWSGL